MTILLYIVLISYNRCTQNYVGIRFKVKADTQSYPRRRMPVMSARQVPETTWWIMEPGKRTAQTHLWR